MPHSSRRRAAVVLAIMLCGAAPRARAQEPLAIRSGERVRVLSEAPRTSGTEPRRVVTIGTLLPPADSSLAVRVSATRVDTIPLFRVRSFAISRGNRPRWRMVVGGVLVGSAVSATAFGVLRLAHADKPDTFADEDPSAVVKIPKNAYFIPVGIGLVLGLTMPTERWASVNLPPH